MSSLQSFLNTAMTIDQQENSAEDNYNYEKEQLGSMYDEQKQQILDSAMQALPFGIAETSRAVGGLWQTGKAIYAFKAKYSPQIEAFKAKAQEVYDNIGKEGGKAVDYGELLKSASTDLGKKALALAAPEVLKRTGIDLNKAVDATKGEGGIEAGLENLRGQGINIAKSKVSGLVEEGTTRLKEVIAPVVAEVQNTVADGVANVKNAVNETVQTAKNTVAGGSAPTRIPDEAGAEGLGAERARNPFTKAVGGGEIANPLFEGVSDEVLAKHANTISGVASNASDEALKAIAGKTKAVIDTFQTNRTALQKKFDETRGLHAEASAKLQRLQDKTPEVTELPSRTMYPAERGKAPSVTQFKTSPDIELAKAEVAKHEATLSDFRTQASDLKTSATSAFEGAKTTLSNVAGKAYGVGKEVLGSGLDVLGVYGGAETIISLNQNKGHVGGEEGTNDVAGLWGAGRSATALTNKAVDLGKQTIAKITGKPIEGAVKEGAKVSVEKPLAEGAVKEGEKVAEKEAIQVGSSETEKLAASTGAKVGAQLGEKLGVGLAEEGAEIGVAAAGASAIPIVGEAIDIGLGLYTAIDAIVNLFKSPPKPPPPPPVQQQVVAFQHQQGVY